MRHPYIITYKESFMDKKCLCIVMDYADGGDLYTKIANQKKIGKGKPLNPSISCTFYMPCKYLN
jgi:serine/threonine protein kinase